MSLTLKDGAAALATRLQHTILYSELSEWRKDNPAILAGYRRYVIWEFIANFLPHRYQGHTSMAGLYFFRVYMFVSSFFLGSNKSFNLISELDLHNETGIPSISICSCNLTLLRP
jgi:hypothetical protein